MEQMVCKNCHEVVQAGEAHYKLASGGHVHASCYNDWRRSQRKGANLRVFAGRGTK